MRIAGRQIGPSEPPYVIAELGVNHDGSPVKALELVEAAHGAGADAVKVQWFKAQDLVSREARLAEYQARAGARDPRTMLALLELEEPVFAAVVRRAHTLGMHAIATIFSPGMAERASRQDFDAHKTAGPDLINQPLLEALMATGRPLLVSTGAATAEEVRLACGWLRGYPHILMQCVSAYPTPEDLASLGGRLALEEIDPAALGYSDHTTALDTGALAVASGACVLEKHLTLDRGTHGPDHAASLEPGQLAEYVRLARRAWVMLGPRRKRLLEVEHDVREASRQSLVAARALPAGTALAEGDLAIKRPGTGIAPWRLRETVGKRLRRPIAADVPIREEDLQ